MRERSKIEIMSHFLPCQAEKLFWQMQNNAEVGANRYKIAKVCLSRRINTQKPLIWGCGMWVWSKLVSLFYKAHIILCHPLTAVYMACPSLSCSRSWCAKQTKEQCPIITKTPSATKSCFSLLRAMLSFTT